MKKNKICIIDYDVGNFFSIHKCIKQFNKNTVVTSDESLINKSDCIVLPGVGSFLSAMTFLKKKKLIKLIKEKERQGTKIIGICLGMQIMMEFGNENGFIPGLNFFKGQAEKIKKNRFYKLPNVGLRDLKINNIKSNKFLKKFNKKNFYYLHSYKVNIEKNNILGWSHIGDFNYNMPAIIRKNNIFGLQFHPEKSGPDGILFLRELLKS